MLDGVVTAVQPGFLSGEGWVGVGEPVVGGGLGHGFGYRINKA